MLDNRKLMAEEWNAGCSALSWSTQDGKHLWGRNFDFNRLAQGTKVSYIPSGTEYYTCGATMERNLDRSSRCRAAYAALGTGFLMIPSVPVLYEGINERGLMGGQLHESPPVWFCADPALGLQRPNWRNDRSRAGPGRAEGISKYHRCDDQQSRIFLASAESFELRWDSGS